MAQQDPNYNNAEFAEIDGKSIIQYNSSLQPAKINIQTFTCTEYLCEYLSSETFGNNYVLIPDAKNPNNGNIDNPYQGMCNVYGTSNFEQMVDIQTNSDIVSSSRAVPEIEIKISLDDLSSSNVILLKELSSLYQTIDRELKRRKIDNKYIIGKAEGNIHNIIKSELISSFNDYLKEAYCKYDGTAHSINGNLSVKGKYPLSNENICQNTIVLSNSLSGLVNDINIIANDCVCYSDCGGYSVCYCYGNCNYY